MQCSGCSVVVVMMDAVQWVWCGGGDNGCSAVVVMMDAVQWVWSGGGDDGCSAVGVVWGWWMQCNERSGGDGGCSAVRAVVLMVDAAVDAAV